MNTPVVVAPASEQARMSTGRSTMWTLAAVKHAVKAASPVIMTSWCDDSFSILRAGSEPSLRGVWKTASPINVKSDSACTYSELATSELWRLPLHNGEPSASLLKEVFRKTNITKDSTTSQRSNTRSFSNLANVFQWQWVTVNPHKNHAQRHSSDKWHKRPSKQFHFLSENFDNGLLPRNDASSWCRMSWWSQGGA